MTVKRGGKRRERERGREGGRERKRGREGGRKGAEFLLFIFIGSEEELSKKGLNTKK